MIWVLHYKKLVQKTNHVIEYRERRFKKGNMFYYPFFYAF